MKGGTLDDWRPPEGGAAEFNLDPKMAAKATLASLSVLHELQGLPLVGPEGDSEARGLL